ncbi:MAG: hypothetical protein R3C28_25435 [Pirellulaceae bacterium]
MKLSFLAKSLDDRLVGSLNSLSRSSARVFLLAIMSKTHHAPAANAPNTPQ